MIVLTDEWTRRHMAQAVPSAFYSREHKAWVLDEPTPRSAAVALRLFPELALQHPELELTRDLLAQDVRPFDNATPYDHRLTFDGADLYNFQQLDLGYVADVLRSHGGAYIGWERGLGKTLGSISLIHELGSNRTLIVCPNTAKESVWAAELERWAPWITTVVLPNTKARRERILREFRPDYLEQWCEGPVVLVVHYEALAIVAGKEKKGGVGRGWDKLGEWDLVIADEAHRIKNPQARMTRALKKVPTRMKVALSGSIIQNHAEELFSPLQWLFPDRYKSKWRDWNDRYLDYVDGGYGRICLGVKLDKLQDLREELGVFMVYRRKEDELDLPDLTEQTLLVDLSSGQRRAYDQLVAACLVELPDGTRIKASDGLVLLGKLRQVATGLDLLGEMRDSTKLDVAEELIRDNPDEAFVVFTWFKAAGRALAERLGADDCFVCDGDVPAAKRAEMIARFQEGEGRIFIGTLSTLSESVNLQRANNVIFLDQSWNPATNVQARDRVYRNGQVRPVTCVYLVARDTVDELRVLPTIANKEALRRIILGGK